MKNSLILVFLIGLILIISTNSVFGVHYEVMMNEDFMMGMYGMNYHHFPHNGMCAPGFTPLSGICVLDDRCGSGAYPGRMCMMDEMMKQYLRPLHQKYAGISTENVICIEGKQLMFKSHNASPTCVYSDSVEKFKNRGWQLEKPPIACTLEYAPVCGVDGRTYGNSCSLMSEHMALKHNGECIVELSINSFEECITAGFPAMESHPRQCRTDDGKHFWEILNP